MRILLIAPLLPYPPQTGGVVRVWQLLRALALEHDVTVLASGQIRSGEEPWLPLPVQFRFVPSGWSIGAGPTLAKRLYQARSLFSQRSALYWSMAAPLRGALGQLDWDSFDVVQVEYSPLGLLPLPRNRLLIVDAHNLEYRVLQRIAEQAPWARRLWLRLEGVRLRRDEHAAWKRATSCLATSTVEAREIESVTAKPVAVVPNGVDAERFVSVPVTQAEPDTVLFVGSYRYWPNSDGVLWFVREIWPVIRSRRPGARLILVGFDPPPVIRRLSMQPGIEVVGTVGEVQPWLAQAAVVIAPLRAGGGTRIKLLEAFAAGRAVVTTPLGAEGIELIAGQHALLASTPQEFADAVVSLLESPERRACLGAAARQLVLDRYSWDRVAEALLGVYRQLSLDSPA